MEKYLYYRNINKKNVVIKMNVIPCIHPCLYQKEGCCTLTQATSNGKSGIVSDCAYFLPSKQQLSQQRQNTVS